MSFSLSLFFFFWQKPVGKANLLWFGREREMYIMDGYLKLLQELVVRLIAGKDLEQLRISLFFIWFFHTCLSLTFFPSTLFIILHPDYGLGSF